MIDALSGDPPEVLFVCIHNAGRSQMEAALLSHHGGDRVVVRSAGDHDGLWRRMPVLSWQAVPGLGTPRPAGKGIDAVRPIRDEIDRRVQALLAELTSPGVAGKS
jgi:arsenate reductase